MLGDPERAGPNVYYAVATNFMPRIPDEHLRSVVYVYPSEEAARLGRQVGGSGFVVNYPSGIGLWRIRYVVTNQHVVDGGGHWVRLNHLGGTHVVHIPPDAWEPAPGGDDFALAVLRLPPNVTPMELSLDNLGVTREMAAALRVGPGDEAYMVGRFLAHGGRTTNNPIARFGSVALMPNPHDLVRDGREKDVEAYLIEMRSHAGFSGAPVFLLIPQFGFRGVIGDTSTETNETRFRLLGIDTGHKIDHMPVSQHSGSEWARREDLVAEHFTDVAIVAPIWKVVDLLEREDLADQRIQMSIELSRRASEIPESDRMSTFVHPANASRDPI
jgi:hypothetical protein